MRIIIDDVLTVTMNEKNDVGTYTIVIEGERIGALTKERVRPRRGDTVMSGAGKVAVPGLVNGHVHSDMTLARGLGDGLTLFEQDQSSPISRKKWFKDDLDGEARRLGRLLQYVEAVKGGTTFLCDVPFWFLGDDLTSPFRNSGLEGAVVIDFREDFLSGKDLTKERYFETASALRGSGIIPVVEGPAEENYEPALLERLAGWAEELDTLMQMHLAETTWRMEIVREKFATTSVRFLRDTGILNGRIIGAHGVYIDEEEVDILREKGARIVNCPTSEMKIADGIAPVAKFIKRGVATGLGTDGALWNDSGDMFSEMKTLMLLQRVHYGASSISSEDCLRAATAEGARVFGVDKDLGSIEPGKRASLVLLDVMKPHSVPFYSGKLSNVEQVLVSCLRASDVDTVIIGGKTVVKGGKLQTLDENSLIRECQEVGTRIFRDLDI